MIPFLIAHEVPQIHIHRGDEVQQIDIFTHHDEVEQEKESVPVFVPIFPVWV